MILTKHNIKKHKERRKSKMKKYTIVRTNTDVRKLWNLASNGILDKRTVIKIFEESNIDVITFNSKYTYDKFLIFQFSNFAYYKN